MTCGGLAVAGRSANSAPGRATGHPRNSFWNIVGSALGFRRDAAPYAAQARALTARGFAVWDVVAECRRRGSLDSAIVDARCAAIERH